MEIIAGYGCDIEGTTEFIHASKAVRRDTRNVTLFQNRELRSLRKVEVIMGIVASDQRTN